MHGQYKLTLLSAVWRWPGYWDTDRFTEGAPLGTVEVDWLPLGQELVIVETEGCTDTDGLSLLGDDEGAPDTEGLSDGACHGPVERCFGPQMGRHGRQRGRVLAHAWRLRWP